MANTTDPVILTVRTGATPLQGVKDYNYVGTFPGTENQHNLPRYPGGAPRKFRVSRETGVTFPYPNTPIKFKV